MNYFTPPPRRPLARLGRFIVLLAAVLLTACPTLPPTALDVRTDPFAYTGGAQ